MSTSCTSEPNESDFSTVKGLGRAFEPSQFLRRKRTNRIDGGAVEHSTLKENESKQQQPDYGSADCPALGARADNSSAFLTQ